MARLAPRSDLIRTPLNDASGVLKIDKPSIDN